MDESFPVSPEYRSQNARLSGGSSSGLHHLESIPELESRPVPKPRTPDKKSTRSPRTKTVPTNDSTVSQLLDSSLYSDEEREHSGVRDRECTHGDDKECLHGDDFDHTSLDSEGCLFSPSSMDLYENTGEVELPVPTNLAEQGIRSPVSELRDSYTNVNPADGRKSAASKVSTGSDVPLDNSELSHARATPPPPLSFRKRRAKGTPKIKMDLHVPSSPITPLTEPLKPPRKRPRKFLSATGVGWTTSVTDKEPVEQLHKSCMVPDEGWAGMPDSCNVYVNVNGTLSKTAENQTIWGYQVGQFMLDPKKRPAKKKSVCFATKDTLIDNENKTPREESEAPTEQSLRLPMRSNFFKPIDAKKITDSVELNKEKMRSGKWRKPVEAKNKEIQTIEAYAVTPVPTLERGRQSLRKTLSDRIAAAISPSPKRSREATFLKKSPDASLSPSEETTKKKISESPTASNTKKDSSPPKEGPSREETAERIDIVSATSIPVKDLPEEAAHSQINTTLPFGQHLHANGGPSKEARPRKLSLRKRLSMKSPFSRFRQSKYKLRKQVSPLDVSTDPVQTPFKREILDGSTYVRMPELEPSYLDNLKQLGRLSPSVRRISQRYCLFEKGPMSRSLEILDNVSSTSSMDNLNTQAMSLPQLTDKYAVFTTQKEQTPVEVKTEHLDDSCEDLNLMEENKENVPQDTKKQKSGKRFSLLSGFGTWPRRMQSPEFSEGDREIKEKPAEEKEKEKEENKKRGLKRKRFSLLRSRWSEANKPAVEDATMTDKSKSVSFLGSLRRRFSQRKANKAASEQDMRLPEKRKSATLPSRIIEYKDGKKRRSVMAVPALSPPRSDQLEVLVDDQVQYTSDVKDEQECLATKQKSRYNRRSLDLWKIESTPDSGEKWVARKRPSMVPTPFRQASDRSYTLTSDSYLQSRVEPQESRDNLLQTELVTKEISSGQKAQRSNIDAFFSRVDEGIGHEEIVDGDIEEDYVVVGDLTEIVYQQELDDAAETVVESVLRKAVQAVERELAASGIKPPKYTAETASWNASGNVQEAASHLAAQALSEELEAIQSQWQTAYTTSSYYRRMKDDYDRLAAEEPIAGNSNVNNSNNNPNLNNNAQLQEHNRRYFDISGDEVRLMDLSPISKSKSAGKRFSPQVLLATTPQKEETEPINLLDAFFGKKPSPVSPEEAKEMKQKLDEFVRYHDENMTPRSCDSPAMKRIRPSCSDEGYSTQSQSHGPQVRHPEEAYSSSLDNWQLWHAALTQQSSGPAVIAQRTELMDVYYQRDQDYSEASSAEPGEILDSGSNGSHIVGFVRAGLSSCSESCESGGVGSTDHNRSFSRRSEVKPAGSMFYGDSPAAEDETMKPGGSHFAVPSPARADPSNRRAGSYFWDTSPCQEHSTNETSTPKAGVSHSHPPVDWWIRMEGEGPKVNHSGYAPTYSSPKPEDRPVGIHYGSPAQPARTPVRPLEERPVGVHSGTSMDQSPEYHRKAPFQKPRQEDRPVGVHSGTSPMDKSPEYRRTSFKSSRLEDRPVGVHSGTSMETNAYTYQAPARCPEPGDRPVGIHGGHVPQPLGRSTGTNSSRSNVHALHSASFNDSSFYSPNSTINFSSSSIVDQLP